MGKERPHSHGRFEYIKFDSRRDSYYDGLKRIEELGYSFQDLLEHYPAFVGHMTISRFLGLYELYKKTLGVAGTYRRNRFL